MTEAPTAPRSEPSSGSGRRHPVARVIGAIVGWVCAGLAVLGLLAHFLDTQHQSLIVLASGAWVFAPLSVIALGLHLWRRGWYSAVIVALVIVAQVVVYAPLFVAQTAPAGGTPVRVMTQNMLFGTANPQNIVARVKSGDVDVLALEELTPQAVTALHQAGLDDVLPHTFNKPVGSASGTGIWSRYAFSDPVNHAGFALETLSVSVVLPTGQHLTVFAVHPAAPFPADPVQWRADTTRLGSLLSAQPAGPVIVAGDFNATWDVAGFRALLRNGYRDGAEQAGVGIVRSWPANRGYPPVIGIDHVLTRGAVATSLATMHGLPSDHMGLLATVVVPR